MQEKCARYLVQCLKMLDVSDLIRPMSLIGRMAQGSRTVTADIVKEGFLCPSVMSKILSPMSPKEVVLDALATLSNLARMSKVSV